MRFPIRFR